MQSFLLKSKSKHPQPAIQVANLALKIQVKALVNVAIIVKRPHDMRAEGLEHSRKNTGGKGPKKTIIIHRCRLV